MQSVGFIASGPGIGDLVQYTSVPENFYRSTGAKLIDCEGKWAFQHNPYVVRDKKPAQIVDFWRFEHPAASSGKSYASLAERVCMQLGSTIGAKIKCHLRHPRLYQYEDLPQLPKRIVIQCNGITTGGLPAHVAQHIKERYRDFDIVQLGDRREDNSIFPYLETASIWDAVKCVAEATMYIGVSSSLMNIAYCYPRVNKKIVLGQYKLAYLAKLRPLDPADVHSHWYDYSAQYFNVTPGDIGITASYLKI